MHTLLAPLRVRSTGEAGRKVTWMELFFDLIFVAAVAQVARPLRDPYSVVGLVHPRGNEAGSNVATVIATIGRGKLIAPVRCLPG